jgi:hypothetical protein
MIRTMPDGFAANREKAILTVRRNMEIGDKDHLALQ